MLQALGLDDAGGTVYQALLTGPAVGVGSLSDRTGLSEALVDKALEALAGLGLVRASSNAPGRWEPVSPQAGLAAIVRRREADLALRQQEIAAAKAAAAAVAAAYAAAYPTSPHIEWLADLESVHAQVQNLARTAVAELQVTVTTPQTSGGWQADSILDYAGLGHRIRLRALCHDSALDDAAAMAQMVRLTGSGAQARITPDLPPVLMICDQQAVLIPLRPAQPGNGAVCVSEPAIVGTLAVMFGNAWNAAIPLMSTIPPAQDVAAGGPTAGETALLRLLATGLTDETAARQLGISVRTARRQVAALMDRLGASSRFQAGHMAARRGWL